MDFERYRTFLPLLLFLAIGLLALFSYLFFKKKKINYLLFVVLFSLLPIITSFRPGLYESGDFNLHAVNILSFFNSLKEGNIVPNWAGEMCNHFGCPEFLFMYPLPYYLGSLLHLIGFSFVTSTKLVYGIDYVVSGIFAYLWIKSETKKGESGFIGALAYLFAPYYLVSLNFLNSIAQVTAYAVFPIILYLIYKYLQKKSFIVLLFLSLAFIFLILSHQPSTLLAGPFILAYTLFTWYRFQRKNFVCLLKIAAGFVYAVIATSFYWAPVLAESRYIGEAKYVSLSSASINELIHTPWLLGFFFQGPKGEIGTPIGYAQWIVIVIAISVITYSFFRTKKINKDLLLFLVTTFIIFFVFSLSPFGNILSNIPLYIHIQTTTRILFVQSLILAGVAGVLGSNILKMKNRAYSRFLFVLLCSFIVLSTVLNWGTRRTISAWNDANLSQSVPTRGEPNIRPIYSPRQYPSVPGQKHIEILQGEAKVRELFRNSTKHVYKIVSQRDSDFVENTFYFPNWNLYIDNKKTNINYKNPKYPGLIAFTAKKGVHTVILQYEYTPLQGITETISFIFLGILLFGISKVLFIRYKDNSGHMLKLNT